MTRIRDFLIAAVLVYWLIVPIGIVILILSMFVMALSVE